MQFLKTDPENLQTRKQTHSSWNGAAITSILSPPSPSSQRHILQNEPEKSTEMEVKNLEWQIRY